MGLFFFEKSWDILIASQMFEQSRPRNEPGKAVLDNSGTQDDGRSSRDHLESLLRPKTIFGVRGTPERDISLLGA